MVTVGIDAHKRTHTVVAVDELGRELGQKTTTATTSDDHLEMLRWAERFGDERTWAVEDCRHLSRRLEADLLGAGERIVRVPPKLMAHARDAARSYGKSDPIDAPAVARAALRHPDLPAAQLDGPARELRLLVDHREDLVAERTRCINRLRWHLHELDPTWDPPARSLTAVKNLDAIAHRLAGIDGPVARIASEIVAHITGLTVRARALEREITALVAGLAPTLLTLVGAACLTAAKIVAETADITRFKNKDAYARHNGTAPLPVWSGNRERHRLSRTGLPDEGGQADGSTSEHSHPSRRRRSRDHAFGRGGRINPRDLLTHERRRRVLCAAARRAALVRHTIGIDSVPSALLVSVRACVADDGNDSVRRRGAPSWSADRVVGSRNGDREWLTEAARRHRRAGADEREVPGGGRAECPSQTRPPRVGRPSRRPVVVRRRRCLRCWWGVSRPRR